MDIKLFLKKINTFSILKSQNSADGKGQRGVMVLPVEHTRPASQGIKFLFSTKLQYFVVQIPNQWTTHIKLKFLLLFSTKLQYICCPNQLMDYISKLSALMCRSMWWKKTQCCQYLSYKHFVFVKKIICMYIELLIVLFLVCFEFCFLVNPNMEWDGAWYGTW